MPNSTLCMTLATLQSGDGAVLRPLQDKLNDELNAADFLPYGYVSDGSVDYTAELQAAVDEAISSGRPLFVPAGSFKVSGTGLTIAPGSTQSFSIRGAGNHISFIVNGDGNAALIEGGFIRIRDIGFQATGGAAIKQTGPVHQMLWDGASIIQLSTGHPGWDNDGEELVDNRFTNFYFQHLDTATVPFFKLVSAVGLVNGNIWANGRCQYSGTAHFFRVEGTGTGGYQFQNKWDTVNFEVCMGGGIRLIACNGYVISNCMNWDVTLGSGGETVNDFYLIERNAGNVASLGGVISDCGRWGGAMAATKYDVNLPTGGGGTGTIITNCRTTGGPGGDPFSVHLQDNAVIVVKTAIQAMSLVGTAGVQLIESESGYFETWTGYKVGANAVVGARKTGWTPATGTAARTAFATYTSQTISNPPTQAQVQAINDHVLILSQRLKALIDDLHATAGHGLIGT